jgi:hypothetical protein
MKTELVIRKLKSTSGGVSRREVLLVALIAVMTLFFAFEGMHFLDMQQRKGNDALRENTAISVARVNSNNGMNCVVDGCGSTGYCPHYSTIGYIGYFDNIGNIIVGEKPKGYNEYNKMEIGKNTYYGDPGTMVLKVVAREGEVTVSWEKGKE